MDSGMANRTRGGRPTRDGSRRAASALIVPGQLKRGGAEASQSGPLGRIDQAEGAHSTQAAQRNMLQEATETRGRCKGMALRRPPPLSR